MPELFFVKENKTVNVAIGSNLREATLDSEISVYSSILTKLFNCRGNGMCGTCTVKIESEDIEPPNEIEQKKLKKKLITEPNLRLACQLNVKTDLNIYTI